MTSPEYKNLRSTSAQLDQMNRWNKILTIKLQEAETLLTCEKSLLHITTLTTSVDNVTELTKMIEKKHDLLLQVHTLQDQVHEATIDFNFCRHRASSTERRQFDRLTDIHRETLRKHRPQWSPTLTPPKRKEQTQPQPFFTDKEVTAYRKNHTGDTNKFKLDYIPSRRLQERLHERDRQFFLTQQDFRQIPQQNWDKYSTRDTHPQAQTHDSRFQPKMDFPPFNPNSSNLIISTQASKWDRESRQQRSQSPPEKDHTSTTRQTNSHFNWDYNQDSTPWTKERSTSPAQRHR